MSDHGRGRTVGIGRKATVVAALCALAVGAAACGSDDEGNATAGGGGEASEVYFSINFTGNAQRQQIMRTMELATEQGPLKGKADLTISTSNNTIQAQAQDINNIVRRKPDAIVILPSSETGLNTAIERACDAGITVVAFDSPVSAECAYNVGVDFVEASKPVGAWLAEQAGGKQGAIFVDQGIAGLPVADQIHEGLVAGIESVGGDIDIAKFQGEFAPGPVKAAVSNLIPAHRDDLIGVATASNTDAVQAALKEGGIDPVPIGAMTALNADTLACLDPKQPCFLGATPMTQGAEALKLAVDLLEGTADEGQRKIVLPLQYLGNDPDRATPPGFPEAKPELIEEGTYAFPDLPPDLSLPYRTDWLDITAAQAAGE